MRAAADDSTPDVARPRDVSRIVPVKRDQLVHQLATTSVVLLDAQAPGWYERERLPGAFRALPEDLPTLEAQLPEGRETNIVVYCYSATCQASEYTARRLVELGYRRVRRYVGGKRDWIDGGMPTERGTR